MYNYYIQPAGDFNGYYINSGMWVDTVDRGRYPLSSSGVESTDLCQSYYPYYDCLSGLPLTNDCQQWYRYKYK